MTVLRNRNIRFAVFATAASMLLGWVYLDRIVKRLLGFGLSGGGAKPARAVATKPKIPHMGSGFAMSNIKTVQSAKEPMGSRREMPVKPEQQIVLRHAPWANRAQGKASLSLILPTRRPAPNYVALPRVLGIFEATE